MRFALNQSRATIGQDIDVCVDADAGQNIAQVVSELDGFTLADDSLNGGTVHYERTFPHAGSGSNGATHALTVTATDQSGKAVSATKIWMDVN
ncbi:MAG: hypothetical protein ACRD3T_22760 [Terriglobia bacterium]